MFKKGYRTDITPLVRRHFKGHQDKLYKFYNRDLVGKLIHKDLIADSNLWLNYEELHPYFDEELVEMVIKRSDKRYDSVCVFEILPVKYLTEEIVSNELREKSHNILFIIKDLFKIVPIELININVLIDLVGGHYDSEKVLSKIPDQDIRNYIKSVL